MMAQRYIVQLPMFWVVVPIRKILWSCKSTFGRLSVLRTNLKRLIFITRITLYCYKICYKYRLYIRAKEIDEMRSKSTKFYWRQKILDANKQTNRLIFFFNLLITPSCPYTFLLFVDSEHPNARNSFIFMHCNSSLLKSLLPCPSAINSFII